MQTLVKEIFPRNPLKIERVTEGVSTYVYRIVFPQETFYLRVLPEAEASFYPEVAVHKQLREMGVKVPEVLHFEPRNELLQRSIMVVAEVKGQPLNQSNSLSQQEIEAITREAGRDLARLNSVLVDGFGWIRRDGPEARHLRAEWSTQRAFALEYWETDVAYLGVHVLQASEVATLEQVRARYDAWLDSEQAFLAHGDFDTCPIYQDDGHYTGIIDFGEIRGTDCWFDLGHFRMRDGEFEHLPFPLLPSLIAGYSEIASLPADYEQHIRFSSLLINVRALVKSLQKRPPNRFTQHQVKRLREDLTTLI